MNKKSILVGSLIAGAMITSGSINASESNDLSFTTLGSGAEVRTALMDNSDSGMSKLLYELSCGTENKEAKKKEESKSKEAKCGEGKCGEGETSKKKDAKASKTEEAAKTKEAKTESKSKDAKCGEGKCGAE